MPNVEPNVEKAPELTSEQDKTCLGPFFISVKKDVYSTHLAREDAALSAHKSWEHDQSDKPVKILSYIGSLPDIYGRDGDFYVDEMTNMLYGPKNGGVWPENGIVAAGLCKRTWIAFTRKRVNPQPVQRGLIWRVGSFFRFLLPIRFFKGIVSLRANS